MPEKRARENLVKLRVQYPQIYCFKLMSLSIPPENVSVYRKETLPKMS